MKLDGTGPKVNATTVDAAGAVMHTDVSATEGFLRKTASETYEAIKTNLGATTDPATTDDVGLGYAIGSRWVNTSTDKEFVCLDATDDAAVWKETTGTGSGSSDHGALTGLTDDDHAQYLLLAGRSGQDISDALSVTPSALANGVPYAYICAEGTTNLVTNPVVESATTGYAAAGGSSVISRDTGTTPFGATASLKTVVTTANDQGWSFSGVSVSSSTDYVFSFWVLSDSGDASLTAQADPDVSAIKELSFVAPDDKFRRFSLQFTTGASDTSVDLKVLTASAASATWYCWGMQLEAKSKATPTCVGSFGAGHSWSGTAHASTSVRAAGSHYIGSPLDGTSNSFVVNRDGSLFDHRAFIELPGLYSQLVDGEYGLEIRGSQKTLQQVGAQGALVRLYNMGDGAALEIESNVAGDNALVVSAPEATTGTIFGVYAPNPITNFVGKFMDFADKSGASHFHVAKNQLQHGGVAIALEKRNVFYGGGRWAPLQIGTGLASGTASGTNLTGSGAAFTTELAVGSLVVLQGEENVVATITGDNAATVENAWASSHIAVAYAYADEQYVPPTLVLENAGGDIGASDGGDHASQGKSNFTSALWVDSSGKLRILRSSAANSVASPTSDTDGSLVTPAGSNVLIARKTADETKNSDATLANDTDMQVTVAANTTYLFEGALFFNSNSSPDIQFGINIPSGRVDVGQHTVQSATNTTKTAIFHTVDASAQTMATNGTDFISVLSGTVEIAGTGGTVAMMWSQQTSNAADTIMYEGSFIKLTEI